MSQKNSEMDYILLNLPKLGAQDIKNILEKYLEILTINNAFIEKKGIGTYLYLDKIPKTTIYYIKKDIENKF